MPHSSNGDSRQHPFRSEQPAVASLPADFGAGGDGAFDRLFPLVYDDLRRIAHRHLALEQSYHTLDTSALVHESYLRLVDRTQTTWRDRAHFLAIASKAMRHILVDHARRRRAEKRGGGRVPVTLQPHMGAEDERTAELLNLEDALRELGTRSERLEQVVECRFFGGMTVEETSAALSVSTRTVERDWTRAKAYLYQLLHPDKTE